MVALLKHPYMSGTYTTLKRALVKYASLIYIITQDVRGTKLLTVSVPELDNNVLRTRFSKVSSLALTDFILHR